jgi:hypothetical protein
MQSSSSPPPFGKEVKRFLNEFFGHIDAGNAAVFAGAGLSVPAGFVNWRDLLRDIADELDLDVDRETDLVSLAQFHVNKYAGNRHALNQAVIEALSADNPPTENHKLLARLPITTWWTTNYDTLIETALRDAGKVVDVKSDVQQLANTRPRRDAIVYKMHGDVERPNDAVVTRDDYERYTLERGPFINALAGDLVSKTFLFVGFSFTDPNLDQVLARVRISFANNQRRHFAIFKTRSKEQGETEEDYAHAKARQLHVIEDLKRFNIGVLLVDDYDQITAILSELERRYRRQTVFVSASAADFAPWGEEAVTQFMRALGAELIKEGGRLATGLGLGVGNALFTGAVEQVVAGHAQHIEDAMIIRPFPQFIPEDRRQQFWRDYRNDLIGRAGIAIFLFGNKVENGRIVPANGMRSEYEIAREHGLAVLPIGATGSTALELASEALTAPDEYFTRLDDESRRTLSELSKPTDDLMSLVKPIVKLVGRVRAGF